MGTAGRQRRWLWPVVAVLVLAGIGAAAAWTGWLSGGRDDPGASQSPSPTAASPHPSGGYAVAAGDGGTALAADGVTPVGYDPSCQGAVQAATNYNTLVVEGRITERWTTESFQAVLDQIVGFGGDDPYGLRAQFVGEREELRSLVGDMTGTPASPALGFAHPERGGYLVRSCSAEGQAVIDIVLYWDEPPGGLMTTFTTMTEPDGREVSTIGPGVYRVSVAWFNGDWRLVEWEELELSGSPVPDDEYGAPSRTNPSAQYRRAWMSASDEPWTEYTNAPR
jgi:hypothetical protein